MSINVNPDDDLLTHMWDTLTGWVPRHLPEAAPTCTSPERPRPAFDHSGCLECDIGTIAFAVYADSSDLWARDETGPLLTTGELIQSIVCHWAEKGHPAAVHMQRIADELELRYGGQA